MHFDPTRLDASQAEVWIDIASVDTGDTERDSTAQEPDWFHVAQFPQAYFQAQRFSLDQEGTLTYRAAATLEIKGQATPIEFFFELGQTPRLVGHARLDRLPLALGTGDWLDTTWVGQYFEVEVALVLAQD